MEIIVYYVLEIIVYYVVQIIVYSAYLDCENIIIYIKNQLKHKVNFVYYGLRGRLLWIIASP